MRRSGDSSIYKSVCNNAIIEGIFRSTNPSIQDLNDRAYTEAGVVLGSNTGNIATTNTATNANVATNTQLKTYTDPAGFFTIQYPADWTVEHKQPVTKFDKRPCQLSKYQ
jgi:hypothetical protein